MKITFDEWKDIHRAAVTAHRALKMLDDVLNETELRHLKAGSHDEAQLMALQGLRLEDARAACLSLRLQQEWTGGDSTDANNFGWREPNCVPVPHLIPGTRGKTLAD